MVWWTLRQLSSKKPETRKRAAEKLGESGDARAIQALIAALNDENSSVREVVLRSLGKIGNKRAVQPLVAALDDTNGSVRKVAVEALSSIGDERAVKPLIAALRRGKVGDTIVNALVGIGKSAIQPLLEVLEAEDGSMRETILAALKELGWEPTTEQLSDSTSYVSSCFSFRFAEEQDDRSYVDFADIGQIDILLGDGKMSEALSMAEKGIKRHPDLDLYYLRAGDILEQLGRYEEMTRLYETGLEKCRRKNCLCESLGTFYFKRGDHQSAVLWWLRGCFTQLDSGIMTNNTPFLSIGALADGLGLYECRDKLLRWADQADPRCLRLSPERLQQMHNAAYREAGKGDDHVWYAIIALCEKEVSSIRKEDAKLLAEAVDESLIRSLLTALRNKDKSVQRAAIDALCEMGDAAIQPLVSALNNVHFLAQAGVGAIEAIGKIGGPLAAEALEDLLAKGNARFGNLIDWQFMRIVALRALGETGEASSVKPLLAALSDREKSMRRAAMEALGNTGNASAIQPLLGVLQNEKEDVRIRVLATKALMKIGLPAFQALAIELKSWSNSNRKCSVSKIRDEVRIVESCIDALEQILKQYAQFISIQDLNAVLAIGSKIEISCDYTSSAHKPNPVRIDCSVLQRFTRRELIRRGENAAS